MKLKKELNTWDILVMAFGAMIGWGWVVSSGEWIQRGGVLGAAIGFVLGGVMIFFVGLSYAELTAAMPQSGGEHVFSLRALGASGSFVCTWAIVLGYIGVVCFEACALPSILAYLFPGFLRGYLYSVAGFDIYASWLAVALLSSVLITAVNIRGAKTAAALQTVLTLMIGGVGIALIAASALRGDAGNLSGQLLAGESFGSSLNHILRVAVITPFFLMGFDVIPQAAAEIDVPAKKIGFIMLLSIVMGVLFYVLIIFAVGYLMGGAEITSSVSGSGLVTADAMEKAFQSRFMAKVLIVGGLCGILTSWNSFLVGGSRAIYALAETHMLPKVFARLHPKHGTPVNAILLIGTLSSLAPLVGRQMLVWVMDAGNLGCCICYCLVSLSFLVLRKKEPGMPRPYRVKHAGLVGSMAVLLSGFMAALYLLPNTGCTLSAEEWMIFGAWTAMGLVFYLRCVKRRGAIREAVGSLLPPAGYGAEDVMLE